jgi:transposase
MQDQRNYPVYVAIDWADQKHDVAVFDPSTGKKEDLVIKHNPEDLADFVAGLRARLGSEQDRVALAVELKRGPLINFLSVFEFIDIYPVKTTTVAHFRKAFYPSGAKSDPLDKDLILDILRKHPDRLEAPWKPETQEVRLLAELTQARRVFVDEITRHCQQIRAVLKSYYPLALEVLGGELDNQMTCDFLLRWPTHESLRKAKPATLRGFFYQHNCRSEQRIVERLERIEKAIPLTNDRAVIEGLSLRVTTLAKAIRPLLSSVREYDTQIKKLFIAHEDAPIFQSLPGAGAALAPRLLATMGTQRERFANAQSLTQYNGSAPVTERSGNQKYVHWRWSAPVFVRQAFVEFAQWSVVHCSWAKAYNELLREKGCPTATRMRKIAFKWSRILLRCWKTRTPYDDERYVESLRKKRSPIWQKLQELSAS